MAVIKKPIIDLENLSRDIPKLQEAMPSTGEYLKSAGQWMTTAASAKIANDMRKVKEAGYFETPAYTYNVGDTPSPMLTTKKRSIKDYLIEDYRGGVEIDKSMLGKKMEESPFWKPIDKEGIGDYNEGERWTKDSIAEYLHVQGMEPEDIKRIVYPGQKYNPHSGNWEQDTRKGLFERMFGEDEHPRGNISPFMEDSLSSLEDAAKTFKGKERPIADNVISLLGEGDLSKLENMSVEEFDVLKNLQRTMDKKDISGMDFRGIPKRTDGEGYQRTVDLLTGELSKDPTDLDKLIEDIGSKKFKVSKKDLKSGYDWKTAKEKHYTPYGNLPGVKSSVDFTGNMKLDEVPLTPYEPSKALKKEPEDKTVGASIKKGYDMQNKWSRAWGAGKFAKDATPILENPLFKGKVYGGSAGPGTKLGPLRNVANLGKYQAGEALKGMLPQAGTAQGPTMQVAKALGNLGKGGLKGLFAGGNTGLLAGMGPLGWSMMGLDLLGDKLFKPHTFLGKIFSDKRLKENIVRVGTSPSGIPIKEFNYKGKEGRYRGVISDDVPWATSKHPKVKYDMVDYSKVDVSFQKIR